jgi:hypothetical protein
MFQQQPPELGRLRLPRSVPAAGIGPRIASTDAHHSPPWSLPVVLLGFLPGPAGDGG